MLAANTAVTAPMTAMNSMVTGARANKIEQRATIYTPAVTIVAAWINALTGVGPAIASGSQTYKGICADLPMAPTNRSIVIQTAVVFPTARSEAELNTVLKVQAAKRCKDEQHSQNKSKIADTIHNESLLGRIARKFLLVPKSDQQVGTEANSLPPEEHEHKIIGEDKIQHCKNKEVQIRKETPEAGIVMHIAD